MVVMHLGCGETSKGVLEYMHVYPNEFEFMLPDSHPFGLNPRCIVFTAAVALSLLPHHLPVSKPIVGTVGAFVGGMVFAYHGYWVYRRRKTTPPSAKGPVCASTILLILAL
jgi:formate/nitrite transporter FocA (FNT family)